MNTKDEALKMAIEAMGEAYRIDGIVLAKAIQACKEALEQPAQEPVAWMDKVYGNLHKVNYGDLIPLYTSPPAPAIVQEPICYLKEVGEHKMLDFANGDDEGAFLVYTSPPAREWVSLSDDEALKEYSNAVTKVITAGNPYTDVSVALATSRAIGQALKAKNT